MSPGPFTPDPLGSTWPAPFPWMSFGFTGPVPGYSLDLVAAPEFEPLDLNDTRAKLNARIDHTDEDVLFRGWIIAARQLVETEAGCALVARTLKLSLPCWPTDGQVRLPIGPVSSVSSVKYYASDGTLTTLAVDTDYQVWLGYRPPTIFPAPSKFWPVVQFGRVPTIEITFVAGYGPTAAAVPELAKQAMLLLIGYWCENRGDEEAPEKLGIPPGAVRLIRMLDAQGYR